MALRNSAGIMKKLMSKSKHSGMRGNGPGPALMVCGLALMIWLTGLVSCSDEASSTYSTKYPVRFYFEVASSTELYNAMGNPGQFVTIRSVGGKVRIANSLGSTDYSLSQIGYREFEYGLGGLIVGTSSTPNMQNGFDFMAYDLACPECDRQTYRLTVKDNGTALCQHCGNSYDLNNYGWILTVGDESREHRGLYRYRIAYNGIAISVSNR